MNAKRSESTFQEAALRADGYGMQLTNPSDGCYQVRDREHGWIYNIYPRRRGQPSKQRRFQPNVWETEGLAQMVVNNLRKYHGIRSRVIEFMLVEVIR